MMIRCADGAWYILANGILRIKSILWKVKKFADVLAMLVAM